MGEKRITTESIVNDLRVIAKYPQNVNAPYICRLAAERLEELEAEVAKLREINAGFALASLFECKPNEDVLSEVKTDG